MLKTKTERVLAFVVVFLAGCVAAPLVVPPAHAGQPVQRWEYACSEANSPNDATAMANKFGAQGWELSAATGAASAGLGEGRSFMWCFKRPVGAASAPVSAQ
jgi:hypothetical protein